MSNLHVLVVTSMWPSAREPWRGRAVEAEVAALERLGVAVELDQIPAGESFRGYFCAGIRTVRDRRSTPRYDLIHAYYGHSGVIARLRRGAPIVLTYCGSDLNGVQREDGSWTWQSRAEVAIFRQLARMVDATITMTTAMETQLPPTCRARNRVIPSGVDLQRFRPFDREEARRRLGWPRVPTALFVGDPRLALKNHRLARATCELARASLPSLRLQVAWGVPPEQIPVWMQAADVLLLTSHAEGSPNVIKEAMASMLPIVSTPVGDVPQRLAGVAGCFVRPPEPAALAAALLQAIAFGRSPQARRAVRNDSIERTAERVLQVYHQVIRCRARKRSRRSALRPTTNSPIGEGHKCES